MSLHDLHEIGLLQIIATPTESGKLGSTWEMCGFVFLNFSGSAHSNVYK